MSIVKQRLVVIISILHIASSYEKLAKCADSANLFRGYDEIKVLNGVKFTLHDNRTSAEISRSAKTNSSGISLKSVVREFLNHHMMEFELSKMLQEEAEVGTPRRRRQQQAFSMILMGIVIFLMFFVTLGFQFLATFSGKAFLMAKMALLLASINGLKRVASSGVHYGLYHTPDPNLYYERFDRPRKLPTKLA